MTSALAIKAWMRRQIPQGTWSEVRVRREECMRCEGAPGKRPSSFLSEWIVLAISQSSVSRGICLLVHSASTLSAFNVADAG